jgi:hypothetical protein
MNPLRRYPVRSSLLRPFRRSQQKTCAAIADALCLFVEIKDYEVERTLSGYLSCAET